jgi:anti-sigma regulatory factor (Ser/Thr protein kinase)
MPLTGVPARDFLNRREELAYLRRLAGLRKDGLAANVLLLGGHGGGKTELLKQLYREVFWEGQEVVPFYYSFRTAALRSSTFAKDYLMRFIKQYAAFVKKEPFLVDDAIVPLTRLLPLLSSTGLDWLIDAVDDFQARSETDDLYGRLLSAISLPAAAAKRGGRQILVMLDDFAASGRLYEASQGDSPGLASLFGESMKNPLCPHIVTGSPAARLEFIFSDHSLHTVTERMHLLPLPEDVACTLFVALLKKRDITCPEGEVIKLVRAVGGNPLYLRNIAMTAGKMMKGELLAKDLLECYFLEVSNGETAFYWSSVLAGYMPERSARRTAIGILLHRLEKPETTDAGRLSQILGVGETDIRQAVELIETNGLDRQDDPVFEDFVHALSLKIAGRPVEAMRDTLKKRFGEKDDESRFEMVIPMTDQAELVVARAVEQIGRNINLDPDLLNGIQLALVETCINAIEHSKSHERKIHIAIVSSPEKMEVMIESPGRHFSLDSLKDISADEKMAVGSKRGWGLTLIRKIMDDVKVERVHNRTRVTLVKHIRNTQAPK